MFFGMILGCLVLDRYFCHKNISHNISKGDDAQMKPVGIMIVHLKKEIVQ